MNLFQIQQVPRRRKAPPALLAPLCIIAIAFPLRADGYDFSQRGTDQICTLTWNNRSRQYLLHVPRSFVPGQSAIVLGFHGSQGSGPTFEGSSLTAKEQVGFVAAYPNATNPPGNTGIWQYDGVNSDDGSTWLWTERGATSPDDIGFVAASSQTMLVAIVSSYEQGEQDEKVSNCVASMWSGNRLRGL
jgi:poly(3-hydroxybutyrate) depolymerase